MLAVSPRLPGAGLGAHWRISVYTGMVTVGPLSHTTRNVIKTIRAVVPKSASSAGAALLPGGGGHGGGAPGKGGGIGGPPPFSALETTETLVAILVDRSQRCAR